jgi:DNA-binding transcriptional ArsR family regulator
MTGIGRPDVLQALADPTRRRIVELLAQGDRSAGELAGEFTVSRPAVSRHLRVLREAGVVTSHADAQRRVYRLEPGPLDELSGWLERTRAFWSDRLDALEVELRRTS